MPKESKYAIDCLVSTGSDKIEWNEVEEFSDKEEAQRKFNALAKVGYTVKLVRLAPSIAETLNIKWGM